MGIRQRRARYIRVPLFLTRLAEAQETARFCADLPDDWLYAGDAADAIIKIADARRLPHAFYQIGTGRRWSPVAWCERLCAAYPRFSYELVGQREQANVGANLPLLGRRFRLTVCGKTLALRSARSGRRVLRLSGMASANWP
jgi:hypothetical protein